MGGHTLQLIRTVVLLKAIGQGNYDRKFRYLIWYVGTIKPGLEVTTNVRTRDSSDIRVSIRQIYKLKEYNSGPVTVSLCTSVLKTSVLRSIM